MFFIIISRNANPVRRVPLGPSPSIPGFRADRHVLLSDTTCFIADEVRIRRPLDVPHNSTIKMHPPAPSDERISPTACRRQPLERTRRTTLYVSILVRPSRLSSYRKRDGALASRNHFPSGERSLLPPSPLAVLRGRETANLGRHSASARLPRDKIARDVRGIAALPPSASRRRAAATYPKRKSNLSRAILGPRAPIRDVISVSLFRLFPPRAAARSTFLFIWEFPCQ